MPTPPLPPELVPLPARVRQAYAAALDAGGTTSVRGMAEALDISPSAAWLALSGLVRLGLVDHGPLLAGGAFHVAAFPVRVAA